MPDVIDRLQGARAALGMKAPVLVATTANLTLSGLQTVDSVALSENDRILVKDQTDPIQNGIYVVATSGWARAVDLDSNSDVVLGTLVPVAAGATNGAFIFRVTTASPSIGEAALNFDTLQLLPVVGTDTLLGRDTAGTGAVEAISVTGGIEFTGSGAIQIADDGVATNKIAPGAVDTTALGDGSVTANKLASNAVTTGKITDANVTAAKIADNNVTTDKILDANVTYAKIQNVSASSRILGRNTSGAGILEEITASQLLDFLSTTRGAALLRGASSWAGSAGTSLGQRLVSGGSGADAVWGGATVQIGSTQNLTGTTVNFTNIPSHFIGLILTWNNMSFGTAARALRVYTSANNGSSYDTTSYSGLILDASSGMIATSSGAVVGPDVASAATADGSGMMYLFGYNTTFGTKLSLWVAANTGGYRWGMTQCYLGGTFNALQMAVTSGASFDGGTASLLGMY